MKHVLGTHMGHFCLQTLCFMLQDDNNFSDTGLISGIIFILNMALLVKKPDNLVGCIPRYILPSILKVRSTTEENFECNLCDSSYYKCLFLGIYFKRFCRISRGCFVHEVYG